MEDDQIQIGNTKIGASTLIKFNLKTLFWVLAIMYGGLSYLYVDLRSRMKGAIEISDHEKAQFLKDVDADWESKLDKIRDIVLDVKLEQADMRGDIKVILDRDARTHAEEAKPHVGIKETTIPPK